MMLLLLSLLVLDRHDYVYPRISPDGRRLVVARAIVRDDGTETTDVQLIDLASGASRELITRKQAEANETYETYIIGLRWLDDRRVEVSLSDGDVGGTDLVVDADTGKVLKSENSEDGDALVPADLGHVVADARFYRRHFTSEELQYSLGSSAVHLDATRILVQRFPRDEPTRPVFLLDHKKRSLKWIADVPEDQQLRGAIAAGDRILFLLQGDGIVTVRSGATTLATLKPPPENDCARLENIAGRIFVFLRPCTRSKPAKGTLWELTRDGPFERLLDEQLDEISASADGSIVAIGAWRGETRIVRVLEGVLAPSSRSSPP